MQQIQQPYPIPAGATLDFSWDPAKYAWLAPGANVASAQFTLGPGLTKVSQSITGNVVRAVLSLDPSFASRTPTYAICTITTDQTPALVRPFKIEYVSL